MAARRRKWQKQDEAEYKESPEYKLQLRMERMRVESLQKKLEMQDREERDLLTAQASLQDFQLANSALTERFSTGEISFEDFTTEQAALANKHSASVMRNAQTAAAFQDILKRNIAQSRFVTGTNRLTRRLQVENKAFELGIDPIMGDDGKLDESATMAAVQKKLSEMKVEERFNMFDEARIKAEGASAARTHGALTKTQADTVNEYSNRINQSSVIKNYKAGKAASAILRNLAESDSSGPSDMAMIFKFMKTFDPESVVRESEYRAAAETGGWFAKLYKLEDKIRKGEFLTPEMKQNFVAAAEQALKGLDTAARAEFDYHVGQAEKVGAPRDAFEPMFPAEGDIDKDTGLPSFTSPEVATEWLLENPDASQVLIGGVIHDVPERMAQEDSTSGQGEAAEAEEGDDSPAPSRTYGSSDLADGAVEDQAEANEGRELGFKELTKRLAVLQERIAELKTSQKRGKGRLSSADMEELRMSMKLAQKTQERLNKM